MLKVENLQLSYRSEPLLTGVDFAIEPGEAVTLIGGSGTGKSSLLRACANLLPIEEGSIKIAGQPIEQGCKLVTYLMQEDLLLPWRTVLGNVRFFSELGPKEKRPVISEERATAMLEELGLKEAIHRYPHQLSGGMRQRVALARALLQDRPLILLDEPFSALDVILRETLYDLLIRLQRRLNRTLLMVTHDFHDAMMLSDRILLLAEGKIRSEWHLHDEARRSPEKMGMLREELRNAMRATC